MKNILLIGFMGCGKSTVSKVISRRYMMDVVEMDTLIEEREGLSIPDIFEKKGEAYFRELETGLLKELRGASNTVISCGGGAPLREENAACMKAIGVTVLLTASADIILERVSRNNKRPLLENNKNTEYITKMMEERRERYEAAADIIINTDNKTVDYVCDEIICALEAF